MGKTDKTQPVDIQRKDPSRRYKRWCSCRVCNGYNMQYLDHRVARMRKRTLLSILTKTTRQDLELIETNIQKTDRWYFPRRKGTP